MKWFLLAAIILLPALILAEKKEAEGKEDELYTNVYVVRPNFLKKLEETTPVLEHVKATEALIRQGITFPPGGSVAYIPATSQLIVRNTQDQMELIEALVDHVNGVRGRQVYIVVREVTFTLKGAKDLGFDWLAPPELPLNGSTPMSGRGRTMDSRESFLKEFSRPPTIPKEPDAKNDHPLSGITGVFTDPQFQVIMRALNQTKGVDLLSAPSVMTRSGDPALIQVGEKRWGVIPVIGADEFTIDLDLFLPKHGKALFAEGEKHEPSSRVTIWDGQIVAWSDKNKDGSTRTVFIKAQLMDPAGRPIHDEEAATPPEASSNDENIEDLLGDSEHYQVKKGDTLYKVARIFGVSTSQLSDANFLSSDILEVGQKLKIPKP
tara:strand:- start:788 stop:1921 length:1134 start_codon:yes stop_codon:yes gene_type:complete